MSPMHSIPIKQHIRKPWQSLPTPSLVVSLPTVEANCTRMLQRVSATGAKFRAHVKTHKTFEGTMLQLGYNLANYQAPKHSSIVVSTFREAWAVVDEQDRTGQHIVTDIVYGLPNVTGESLAQIIALSGKVEVFTVLIDSVDHVRTIEEFKSDAPFDPINVMIKLDAGTNRAGIANTSYLTEVINAIGECEKVELRGFYVHSGHSYNVNSIEEAEAALVEELETIKKGLDQLEVVSPSTDLSKLIVSVGATPTTHSLDHHVFQKTNDRIVAIQKSLKSQLEFHAGNFLFCDLQQVSTGCIGIQNIAAKVVGTVISQYPGRNDPVGELLTNTGVISMSKEVARHYPGFGVVETDPKYGHWFIDHMSQEHGILRPSSPEGAQLIPIGTKCRILPNHSCITANSFNAYYILDADDKVCDVWIPWRGW
ncbi:D-serine ammonia-lyase DSD1 CYBJADRAFT_176749 [Cyberlindnera jadinii NRRL Y-1542]|uniref:D-serine dehydratase n=1 Tax=Cyberlindnera jadinii (strain ATCC 18201 / CBS 1600 / BCRC 20928 / JCM 3617 / NBRC 0987 / NRRL Y-1542) TaxID=983966 RepID=A0A1E4S503_CYBJN|nr:hypothetical protein CYBJADRAFT_176749 [Cyberlindnera jadinii NRRL Y-1542]ODV74581.1 hypothetical protein CYBJADRAFT_176749 [Cyberlindnera jadinii NRRL Y-1542]